MKMSHQARTPVADRAAVELFQANSNEEDDHDFLDVMESFSLSREELEAFVAMPELTLAQARRQSRRLRRKLILRSNPPDLYRNT